MSFQARTTERLPWIHAIQERLMWPIAKIEAISWILAEISAWPRLDGAERR